MSRPGRNRSGAPAVGRARGLALAIAASGLLHATPSLAAERTIHVSTRGVDSADGTTPAAAVRTLSRAFQLAAGAPSSIHVTMGRFEEPRLEPPLNAAIRGSWDLSFSKQETFGERKLRGLHPKDDLCSAHTCLVAKDTDRTVVLSKPGVSLERLVVIGPDRSKTVGSNSFALVVQHADARLAEVVLQGGRAGPGRAGSTGKPGKGSCTYGVRGGWATPSDDNGIVCSVHQASAGRGVTAYGRTANGGVAGDAGESHCSMWGWSKNSDLDNGGDGGPGDAGIEGPAGATSAPDKGGIARDAQGQWQWLSRSVPPRGQSGSAGASGGGGGAGGSWNIVYWCLMSYVALGGSGHLGNDGGCGGEGGGGGESGGSASALLVIDADLRTHDVVVFGGQGGPGGTGGNGEKGSPGEAYDALGNAGSSVYGCSTGPKRTAGTGGRGGSGGRGGGGGGGAGGNGGPEFAVIEVGKATIRYDGVYRIEGGVPGAGSRGGTGADSRTVAPSGVEGLSLKQIKLDVAK
ncbi:hypothetical protein [Tahibacter sp.]|uniref:hypothetical protein n=1 Tax=Tahibacter sp. TaxID=2056211 RepID=UPI0028C4CF1D|nr:hypothetical protein [Tahibacter sp.]